MILSYFGIFVVGAAVGYYFYQLYNVRNQGLGYFSNLHRLISNGVGWFVGGLVGLLLYQAFLTLSMNNPFNGVGIMTIVGVVSVLAYHTVEYFVSLIAVRILGPDDSGLEGGKK